MMMMKDTDTDTDNNHNADASKANDRAATTTTATTASSIPSQEESANFLARLTFAWTRPLFRKATDLRKDRSTLLQLDDLLQLPPWDHGHAIYEQFCQAWNETADANADAATNTIPSGAKNFSEQVEEQGGKMDRLQHAVFHVAGRRFVVAGCIKVVNTCLQFSFPLLLQAILKFIEDTQQGRIAEDAPWMEQYRGYWLSLVLFLAMASKAVTENTYFQRVFRAGYQARVAISLAVYRKALVLANAARQSTTLGELVNLMQVDATKIEMFMPQCHVLWDGLLQISGYMVILYTLIGWPCLAGLLVMILAGPIQGIIMGKLFGMNRQMVKYTDGRVKTTNEALQGIQSVKMFAWEDNFGRNITVNRHEELNLLRKIAYLRGFSRAYMSALPGLVAVASFVVLSVANTTEIKASTLFAALVAFDQLRFPLLFYPVALAQLAQAKVSAARVQTFLQLPEVGAALALPAPTANKKNKEDNDDAPRELEGKYVRELTPATEGAGDIQLQDTTIYWNHPDVPLDDSTHHSRKSKKSSAGSDDEKSSRSLTEPSASFAEAPRYAKPILNRVNMTVQPGQLCAVVGRVASGKSTLCSTILHETLLAEGKVKLTGKVAYAAQSAWIMNATVRDNILFGHALDEERYQRVLQVCQLEHDLDMLDAGDLTEIGEKGVNLSGGQRQRVSVSSGPGIFRHGCRLGFSQLVIDVIKRWHVLVTRMRTRSFLMIH